MFFRCLSAAPVILGTFLAENHKHINARYVHAIVFFFSLFFSRAAAFSYCTVYVPDLLVVVVG